MDKKSQNQGQNLQGLPPVDEAERKYKLNTAQELMDNKQFCQVDTLTEHSQHQGYVESIDEDGGGINFYDTDERRTFHLPITLVGPISPITSYAPTSGAPGQSESLQSRRRW